jgi:hypothetical protein
MLAENFLSLLLVRRLQQNTSRFVTQMADENAAAQRNLAERKERIRNIGATEVGILVSMWSSDV